MLYVLIADGTFDQICETSATANKEKRDLIKLGCEVKIKKFPNWESAQAYADKF